MKFLNKAYVIQNIPSSEFENARKELEEYEFNGLIEFVAAPVFLMDSGYNFVIKQGVTTMLINGVLTEIDGEKFEQVNSIKLSRNYTLQDFFNENKNAKCIVFYITSSDSVFHEGNKIRPKIIENNG